jgi:hypothetical protein
MVVDFARGALPLGTYYSISWKIFARYGKHFLVLLFLIILPVSVLEQDWLPAALREYYPSLGNIVEILSLTLLPMIQLAATMYVMLLAAHELQGKVVKPGSLSALVRDNYLLVFGGSLAYLLFIVIGLILIILPGLLIGLMYCFYMEFILIERDGISAAFSRSWGLVRMFFWRVALVNLVFILPWVIGIALPTFLGFDPLQNTVNAIAVNAYGFLLTLPSVVLFFNLRAMQKAAETAAVEVLAGEAGTAVPLAAADATAAAEPPSAEPPSAEPPSAV